jgi:hypothetical protein
VQERGGNTLECIRHRQKRILNRAPMAQQLRERIDKWDYMKLKKLLHSKGYGHHTEKAAHRMGENLCQLHIPKYQ